jgi:8-oxo-dGTP pyrophosphatase MutT (NUDIX family)
MWTILFPGEDAIDIDNICEEVGVLHLFEPVTDIVNIELVEMVDRDAFPLGMVPRPLMHTFNLLHRGIGMVVAKDASINVHTTEFPDLYVHRRTDEKRIFPSLFDMFVGGVSSAKEDPRATAAREIAEELGLSRALVDPTALSKALFDCTVFTPYNRCIVTVYCFHFDSSRDDISWQPEEVAWGEFLPYSVVESSARQCIKRLLSAESWPGEPPFALTLQNQDAKSADGCGDENDWDYVPDGLLVYDAWLKWLDPSQRQNL